MGERLGNVPMAPEEYSAQRNTILTIATNNGFTANMVIKISNKFQKKKLNKLLFSPGPIADEYGNKFSKIPYLGNVSAKVGKQLWKYGILGRFIFAVRPIPPK